MKEILETLKNTFLKYKGYILMGLALLITLIFLGISCSNNRDIRRKYDINTRALTDTIEYYQTKSGKLAVEKSILQGDIHDLKELNEDLYKKVKDLEVKKPEQVVYVETEIVNEVHDTTYIIDPSLSYQRKDFDFSNQFRTLTGFMELKDNTLGLNFIEDKVLVDYTLAIKDNKVFLTSSNPYVQYNEIQGISIPPRKKPKFSISVGPSIGIGYDIINKQPGIYAGLSVNAGYNLITF